MKFVELKKLNEKHPRAVVIGLVGRYYTATGTNAVILSQEIGLNKFCSDVDYCKEDCSMCTIGFPKVAFKKYKNLIQSKDIAFAIYKYCDGNPLYFFNGTRCKDDIQITQSRLDCSFYKKKNANDKKLEEEGLKNLEQFNARFDDEISKKRKKPK